MSTISTPPVTSHVPEVRLTALSEPILVTGAAGFIGRRMVQRLLNEGKRVVAFDLIACPESLEHEAALDWIQGDITVYASVQSAMSECRTIFHLAAMVGDWGEPERHEAVTVTGTRHVFDAALACELSPRIVLASSIVVYGDQINQGLVHEGLPLGKTFGPYSQSKQAQEYLAQCYIQQGLDIRVVRPANVYGAGSKPWVEDLCKELKKGVPALVSGGDFDAGLVHVDNVIDIMLRACRCDEARGQIFNAADEEEITWKRYMSDIAGICDAPSPRSIPRKVAYYLARAFEGSYRALNIVSRPSLTLEALNLVGSRHRIDMSKTKRVLGYTVVTDYASGLAEVKDYLQN